MSANRSEQSYSDVQRAETLATLDSNAGNLSATSRETGIPIMTIWEWKNGRHNSSVTEIRKEKQEELASIFERVARLYLDRAQDTDAILDTKGKDSVVAAAVAAEKNQLLTGNPTAITESKDSKSVEFIETFKQIIQARQSQFPHLTIVQINLQVREEMTSKGLGSLLRLLPDVTEEP